MMKTYLGLSDDIIQNILNSCNQLIYGITLITISYFIVVVFTIFTRCELQMLFIYIYIYATILILK